MKLPDGQKPFDIVEVRFKNGRKDFYHNHRELALVPGETIALDTNPGFDVGTVSMVGELVRLQLKKKAILSNTEYPKILRKTSQKDLDQWKQAYDKEHETMVKAREIASEQKLEMKISDVEYQADGSKAVFYYTAENRVDFRQLIRDYASAFHIRVEMRQIGFRQEAARVGGIGSCGRELCCTSWLSDFRSVSTSAARYQQLALNPQKLAGQCGKLKCCLNYELDTYLEAVKGFPDTSKKLHTEKGLATFMKMDIFKGFLWYAYKEDMINWIKLKADDVNEILAKNKKGEKIADLSSYALQEELKENKTVSTEIVAVEQDDINRFDAKKSNPKRRNNRNKNKARTPNSQSPRNKNAK
jgi:cell fate regulator YaaT (PSP1 superfamily)